MNAVYRMFLTVCFFLFLISCDDQSKAVEDLNKEVIVMHDEAMAKMDEMMQLRSKLDALIRDSSATDMQEERANVLRESLVEADRAMMRWMRQYDSQMEGMSKEEKLEYLQTQKKAISQVKEEVFEASNEASRFLEEN